MNGIGCVIRFCSSIFELRALTRPLSEGRSIDLFPQAEPGDEAIHDLATPRPLADIEHLLAIRDGDVAATQAADEVHDGGSLLQRIERRANLMQEDATVVRRAVGEVAVD